VSLTLNSLTLTAIFAAKNINKELTIMGVFEAHLAIYNDSFGKRQIDGKSRFGAHLTDH